MPAARVQALHPGAFHAEATLDTNAPGAVDLNAAFTEHAEWLCRAIHAMVGSRQLAEEVVQDTFCHAFEHRAVLYAGPGLRKWLYTVARNRAMHRIRSRSRLRTFIERLFLEPGRPSSTPQEHVEQRQQAERIHRCLQRVREPYRETLVLFELQGLSGADIAELLDISRNTVDSRLSRGRQQFRQAWAAEEGP